MTDEKKTLPDIPAGAAEQIIKAAANISGKAAGDLNLEQAIGILQGDNPNPFINALLDRTAETAAGALFDGLTDEQAAALTEAAKNGTLQQGLAQAAQEIAQQLTDALQDIQSIQDGKPTTGRTDQRIQDLKETAARLTGRSADDLTIDDAIEIVRTHPKTRELLPHLIQDILTKGAKTGSVFDIIGQTTEDDLAELLQQEPAEDQQQDGAEPVKKEAAADDPDDRQHVIRIDPPEYDPTLDPDSPEFDPEKWKAATAAASESLKQTLQQTQTAIAAAMRPAMDAANVGRAIAESMDRIRQPYIDAIQTIADRNRAIAEAMRSPAIDAIQQSVSAMQESLGRISAAIAPTITGMQNYFNSDAWQNIRETLEQIAAVAPAWLELADEITELTPYLEAELQKPEYEGMSIDDLFDTAETDDDGNPLETSLFIQALNAARAARDADTERKQLPQVTYQGSTEVKTVTDKFANLFFSLTAPQSRGMINGQRQFIPVRYGRRGAKKEITLLYDYSFNEDIIKRFGLSRNFDDQSFFVASIIDNLLDEGNSTVSLTKVWHELGNTGSPNTDALTNLVNILRLGMSTIITADISQVNSAWGIEKDGKTRELISPVIPVQIAQEKFAANGKTASALINITGHTPFYIIGYPLDHYTTWNKDVLRLYKGRRTKRYYSVLRFLITQIGWMRNGKSGRSNKILYESLYSYTGDKSTRARQLSRDMMYRLFDEVFIPTGYISAYKEDNSGKPGVMLTYTQTPKLTAGKKKKQ